MTPFRRSLCLLIAVLCLPLSASAIRLLGDWESSGDMPPAYVPPYSYHYECQVEVSDQRVHRIRGQEHQVYAVAQFALVPGTSSVRGQDLKWLTVIRNSQSFEPEIVSEPIPFSIDQVFIAVGFSQARAGQDDRVNLWAQIGLHFDEEFVIDGAHQVYSRKDPTIRASASISSVTNSEVQGRTRMIYVECERQK